jgi:hypothetical protein
MHHAANTKIIMRIKRINSERGINLVNLVQQDGFKVMPTSLIAKYVPLVPLRTLPLLAALLAHFVLLGYILLKP